MALFGFLQPKTKKTEQQAPAPAPAAEPDLFAPARARFGDAFAEKLRALVGPSMVSLLDEPPFVVVRCPTATGLRCFVASDGAPVELIGADGLGVVLAQAVTARSEPAALILQ